MWRIERPGTVPINGHVSETALDGWRFDEEIVNDRTVDDLERIVDMALELHRA